MDKLIKNILENEKIMKRINKIKSGEKAKTESWEEITMSLIVRDCITGTDVVDECGNFDPAIIKNALNEVLSK
jgi:hypothetical protein